MFAYFKKDLAVPETTWSIQNKYLPLEYNNSTGLRLRLQIPLPEGFQFNLKVPLTGSDDKTSSLTNAADQVNSADFALLALRLTTGSEYVYGGQFAHSREDTSYVNFASDRVQVRTQQIVQVSSDIAPAQVDVTKYAAGK